MPRPPRIMTCRHCEDEFDRMSSIKRRVGGYIDECPDCVEELGTEKAVRYRGVITGDGKQASVTLLKFDSEDDAEEYCKRYNNNSGWQNNYSFGLNDIKHKKVGENIGNNHHKGRA